ncbi:MAG: DUF3299 domain-containing protein [Gammaproteobacteria bacterium]
MNFFTKTKIHDYITSSIILISLSTSTLLAEEIRELDWNDLAPAGYLESLNYNKPLTFSNFFDNLTDLVTLNSSDEVSNTPQATLANAPIVPELNNQHIKLAGFVTPLKFDLNSGTFNEFLLVPYFGACIHVPPPPTNQMVYVTSNTPLEENMLDNPVWIQGILKTEDVKSELGRASYIMKNAHIEVYKEK